MSVTTIEEARAARDGLTFDWRARNGRPFWLFLFIVLSIVGHVACFYLFQVVYPPQERELLRPVEVTVLDPDDPLSRHVLSRIDDRVVAFDARVSFELPGEEEPASEVRLHPSFEGYQPKLKQLPPPSRELGELFVAGNLYLPTPAGAAVETLQEPLESPPVRPVATLRWQGEPREVLLPFEWEPETPPARSEEIESAVFLLGVDGAGRVVHCLPDQSAGGEMDALLIPALQRMEFTARPSASGQSVDWVWADILW